MSKKELEEGSKFTPRFSDDTGLIPCITICADSGKVLMLAYMNEEALQKTIDSKEAHYYSRSRKCLWHKGATSGYTQKVKEIKTDCDQDCLLISVEVQKPQIKEKGQGKEKTKEEGTCHTGRDTCFYRRLEIDKAGSKTTDNRYPKLIQITEI